MWEDANFSGGFISAAAYTVANFNSPGYSFDNGHPINDAVSSIWNRTSQPLVFYVDADWKNACLTLQPGASAANLVDYGCNDALSSYYDQNA